MASDLRRETVISLKQMGIGVEYSHHEVAPSQHEIDMRYDDALKMADNMVTYRLTVKEVATKYAQTTIWRKRVRNARPPITI